MERVDEGDKTRVYGGETRSHDDKRRGQRFEKTKKAAHPI
jgi:hypothetical protein